MEQGRESEFSKVKGTCYPLAGPNMDFVGLWPSHSKSQLNVCLGMLFWFVSRLRTSVSHVHLGHLQILAA